MLPETEFEPVIEPDTELDPEEDPETELDDENELVLEGVGLEQYLKTLLLL